MRHRMIEVAAIVLTLGIAGVSVEPANAQNVVATDGYVTHNDPNFKGNGNDPVANLAWIDNDGVPALSARGVASVLYLGFDRRTGRSYLNRGTQGGNFYSYTKAEGLVKVDSLPKLLVKPKRIANNAGFYGGADTQAASTGAQNTTGAPAASGSTRIANEGGMWKVMFNENGENKTLPIHRAHLRTGVKDFPLSEFDKPAFQTGQGMWFAQDGDKMRIVNAVPNNPLVASPVIVRVEVGPALPKAELVSGLSRGGIAYLDD